MTLVKMTLKYHLHQLAFARLHHPKFEWLETTNIMP